MKSPCKTVLAWLIGGVAGVCGNALVCAAPFAHAETTSIPAIEHQGRVDYVSGGVSLDESTALRAQASKWPLTMEFIGAGGEYLSDVKVVLLNSQDQIVLDTLAQGPYLLVRVPPGNYTARVTHTGQSQSRQFNVAGQGGTRLRFTWVKQK